MPRRRLSRKAGLPPPPPVDLASSRAQSMTPRIVVADHPVAAGRRLARPASQRLRFRRTALGRSQRHDGVSGIPIAHPPRASPL